MDIIALRGNQNQGKSETLNIVYQYMLLFGYTQVPGHFRILGNPVQKDFIDILEKKGQRIGIATMGDYQGKITGDTVEGLLTYLQSNGCDKAICACRNNLPQAIAFIQNFTHVFINKTITSIPAEQRIRNGENAERIYKLI